MGRIREISGVLCVFGLVVCSTVNAAEWLLFFQNVSGVKFSIDSSSLVKLPGGSVRAWERQEFEKRDPKIGRGFYWLIEVNCKNRTYQLKKIEAIEGTSDAVAIASLREQYFEGPTYFNPDALDEARYSAFCLAH